MEYDINSVLTAVKALAPVVIATDTTTVCATIDNALFEALLYQVISGVVTDGAYVCHLYESDDSGMSGETEVTDAGSLNGTVPSFALTDDGVVKQFGYRGKKRYTRLKIVSTATTSGGLFSVLALKGQGRHQG